jgi:hypothetical protein
MPQLGYLAFMDFPHDGVDRISHIGIVVGLMENNQVLLIEGNTSGTGDQRNGGMVMVKIRHYGEGKEVVGFGVPKFAPYKGDFPTVAIPTSGVKPKKEKKSKKVQTEPLEPLVKPEDVPEGLECEPIKKSKKMRKPKLERS